MSANCEASHRHYFVAVQPIIPSKLCCLLLIRKLAFEHVILLNESGAINKVGVIRPSKYLHRLIKRFVKKENVSYQNVPKFFCKYVCIYIFFNRKNIFTLAVHVYQCWYHLNHGYLPILEVIF